MDTAFFVVQGPGAWVSAPGSWGKIPSYAFLPRRGRSLASSSFMVVGCPHFVSVGRCFVSGLADLSMVRLDSLGLVSRERQDSIQWFCDCFIQRAWSRLKKGLDPNNLKGLIPTKSWAWSPDSHTSHSLHLLPWWRRTFSRDGEGPSVVHFGWARSWTNNHIYHPLFTSDELGLRPTINSNSLPTVDYLGRVTQLGHWPPSEIFQIRRSYAQIPRNQSPITLVKKVNKYFIKDFIN